MRQRKLFADERELFDQLCEPWYLQRGFKAVKKNGGAPGVDGVTIEDFETCLDEELNRLQEDLASWNYQPQPVRRVEIPKPGKGAGVRLLGVPCVRDRVVHATIKLLLEPILDPRFSDHSYGFRPNRNQRQAVDAMHQIVKSGKEYVVSIDLSKFFDRVNHDRLISLLSHRLSDKRILRVIGLILRSGVMIDGKILLSKEGTPQGSPLSPLLSNVVLDELDKELERRELEFCRFADDFNIFVRSQKAAERVMSSISNYVEKKLKLRINRDKSKAGLSSEITFLGLTIIEETIAISSKSMKSARQKVKELTPRGTHLPLEKTIERINQWYVGWSGYYRITQYPAQLRNIESHIRRRLRSRLVDQQKRRRHLYKKLLKRGVSYRSASRTAFSNKGRWATSHTMALAMAYPVRWFTHERGLMISSDRGYPHWFPCSQWIKVT